MIVAAVLICDRKAYSQDYALRALIEDPVVDRIYLNIETSKPARYDGLIHFMDTCGKPYDVDFWSTTSSWLIPPQFDQDQRRLVPITRARNMAIDYAMFGQADYLLFVDADVVPDKGSIARLVNLRRNLVGGLVPGRGVHSHVHYVFYSRRPPVYEGPLIICDHGTCGFMLISRKVFSQLRFRYGGDPEGLTGDVLSEDPAYCIDWYVRTGERFVIHKQATARHLDDPRHPLTEQETAVETPEAVYRGYP